MSDRPVQRKDANPKRGSRSLWIVLLVVFVFSSVLGVMAFQRYRASEKYIKRSMGELEAKGKALSVEGCVDWVLAWHKRCEAMAGLCQAAVTRLMGVCLRAQPRQAYCGGLKRSTTATDFGYDECKARGVKRHAKKACAGRGELFNKARATSTGQKRCSVSLL